MCSHYGTFTTLYNAANPANLVARNYLTMPGLFSVNLRLYRTFGFGGGHKKEQAAQQGPMGPGGRGGMMGMMGGRPGGGSGGDHGGPGGFGGGPGGMMGGGGSSEHPYNLTLSVTFENLLNHFNPGGYQGAITSPYFLQATSVNTGFGGGFPGGGPGGPGGFASAANNRRIQLGLRFTF